jgi:hypothetical protein
VAVLPAVATALYAPPLAYILLPGRAFLAIVVQRYQVPIEKVETVGAILAAQGALQR